jgi:phosphopantetheinyl transferase (holo-ACP synthase)
MIGNDVVDLAEAGEPTPRFLARVLAPAEQARVREGGARVAWRLWAAKEAAYKALARRDPELPFAHARFVVDLDAGVVRHGDDVVPVRWTDDGQTITCVAHDEAGGGELLAAVARTAAVEDAASAPPCERPSIAARWLARRMLSRALGAALPELEVIRPGRGEGRRPGAPEVWRRGARLEGVELSLSHDGDFVACAAVVRHR